MLNRRSFLRSASAGALSVYMGQELMAMEHARQTTGIAIEDTIWLASNLNPLGASPKAMQALSDSSNQAYRYGGHKALALQEKLHQHHNLPFQSYEDPKQYFAKYDAFTRNPVLIGNGCTQLLNAAAMAFGDNGGNYIESFPTYNQLGRTVTEHHPGMKRAQIPVNDEYQNNIPAILAATNKNTRFIYLVNPTNPTGTVTAKADLMRLINETPENVIIIIDEAYMELADPGATVSLIPESLKRPNLLVFKTFSKVYGLAGLRVGYAIGPVPLLQQLNRRTDGMGFQNLVSMAAASAALDDKAFIQASIHHGNKTKAVMQQRFSDYGFTPIPSHTSFMWVKTGRNNTAAVETLRRRGVFIKDGQSYWQRPGYLRVSVGSDDDMARFYRHFEEVMGV
ncbi:Histidinol-phosphate aminotransferase [BD1-7 clade bacterium]|uniref:Histidinol-phosphate aminotransferase n=1 Tax=BD1-7 clade bacterium TaxID=2029982 RepID=A0A5S9NYC3_9GAMM|nr:Histidinol-phosphate aminotransferase [BD1-7 clade bacterium]CAA0095800.1 Histidinol-phosphate aminotransferase [BD1-7 clade bacterium]